jgi:hypothetical protein
MRQRRKQGRPSVFSRRLADRLCRLLANGYSLKSICRRNCFPSHETVRRWLRDKPEFRAQYARAREDQADALAEEIIDIADAAADPQLGRLRVDARKWVAAKLKPRKYGELTRNEHSGPDGAPIQTESKVDLSGVPIDVLRSLLVDDAATNNQT